MAYAIPPSPTGSDTGLPSNVGGGPCAVFHIFGRVISYLIEKKDLFVRHWAVQAIYFGGASVGANLAISILSAVCLHLPGDGLISIPLFFMLSMIVQIGGLILWVLGIIKAFQGQQWE